MSLFAFPSTQTHLGGSSRRRLVDDGIQVLVGFHNDAIFPRIQISKPEPAGGDEQDNAPAYDVKNKKMKKVKQTGSKQ